MHNLLVPAPAASEGFSTTFFPVHENPNEFIKKGATGKAVHWLQDKNGSVGVMIAGNFGRPGGACMDSADQFVFQHKAHTQEESALSFIADLDKRNLKEIARQLGRSGFGSKYRMMPPNGTPNDFLVLDELFLVILGGLVICYFLRQLRLAGKKVAQTVCEYPDCRAHSVSAPLRLLGWVSESQWGRHLSVVCGWS